MLDFSSYKASLMSRGANISQVRRNQSDSIINLTFKDDPTYKYCKILTKEGWMMVDAKYQKHTTPSILKDEVDYYLQFRPGVHFPLGTYVIIPDDASFEINTPDNPFDQPIAERTQWWLIVGKTDANAYVRYSVLKCNWNFKWLNNGVVQNVFGCIRSASSYTSGVWTSDYSTALDNITAAWLPDITYAYGEKYSELGLQDVRTLDYGQRFMITDNDIHPKCYITTKVVELVPAGVIKLTLKQDDYNIKRDNVQLKICDYYNDSGISLADIPAPNISEEAGISTIHWMYLNDDGELDYISNSVEPIKKVLHLRETSYFLAEFSDDYTGKYIWNLTLNDLDDVFTDIREEQLTNYIRVTDFEDGSVSLKPERVKDLIGCKFTLSVSDENGGHYSIIEMEVES